MSCRGGFLPHRLLCAPPVAAPLEWPVGQRIFERGNPILSAVDNLPRLTARRIAICRGRSPVRFAAELSQGGGNVQDGTKSSAILYLLVRTRAVRGSAAVSCAGVSKMLTPLEKTFSMRQYGETVCGCTTTLRGVSPSLCARLVPTLWLI